jgi:hypothetical protein
MLLSVEQPGRVNCGFKIKDFDFTMAPCPSITFALRGQGLDTFPRGSLRCTNFNCRCHPHRSRCQSVLSAQPVYPSATSQHQPKKAGTTETYLQATANTVQFTHRISVASSRRRWTYALAGDFGPIGTPRRRHRDGARSFSGPLSLRAVRGLLPHRQFRVNTTGKRRSLRRLWHEFNCFDLVGPSQAAERKELRSRDYDACRLSFEGRSGCNLRRAIRVRSTESPRLRLCCDVRGQVLDSRFQNGRLQRCDGAGGRPSVPSRFGGQTNPSQGTDREASALWL